MVNYKINGKWVPTDLALAYCTMIDDTKAVTYIKSFEEIDFRITHKVWMQQDGIIKNLSRIVDRGIPVRVITKEASIEVTQAPYNYTVIWQTKNMDEKDTVYCSKIVLEKNYYLV